MNALLIVLLLGASPASASVAFEQLLRAAGQASAPIAVAAPAGRSRSDEPCLFDGRTGARTSLAAALATAARARVVYAGEKHGDARHHRMQAELIARLGAAAGFEMLHGSHQAELDAFLSGALSEADFVSLAWRPDWGYPLDLYRPVFEALGSGSRLGAALNVPRAIVHKVASRGLASLDERERLEVPSDFRRVSDPGYVAMLAETFAAHGGDPAEPASFGRFVDAMSLWNEGMAARLAAFLPRAGARPVVVLAGAFHVFDAGMPASVARRAPVPQVSFFLSSAASCPARLDPADVSLGADFVWLAN